MKKLLLFLLSLTLTVGTLSACNLFESDTSSGSPSSETTSEAPSESTTPAEKTYTVTFMQEGMNDIVKTVKKGETLTDIPQVEQKVGYTTVWSVTDFSNITENMMVTAISTPHEYTITYDAGEGTVENTTQTVTYDAVPGSFATPTRENYTFVCWTYEGNVVLPTDAWKIARDITLVAQWQENQKYTVEFVQTGFTTITFEVYEGGSISMDDVAAPQAVTGYTVVWNMEGVDLTNITAPITVTAKATANEYTITYDAGEGAVETKTQKVTFDSIPGTFATPKRDNYTFMYWTYEGNAVSATEAWKIAKDVTLVAKWQENEKFVVEFVQSGCTTLSFEVYEGKAFSMKDVPAPHAVEGYTVEWDVTGIDFSKITKSITVNVKATPNEYTITYDAGEGTVDNKTQTVTFDAVPGTFATPTLANHKFVCWTYEGNPVLPTDVWKIAKNVTLVAKWEEFKKYTLTFTQSGYAPIEAQVYEGSAFDINSIAKPQPRKGYTVEWNLDGVDLSKITAPITIMAKETANTYKITYDAGEGTVSQATQRVTYDQVPNAFAAAERTGYKFVCWTYNGQLVSPDFVWSIDSDVTLVAKWEEIVFTITFDANGGSFTDGTEELTVEVAYSELYVFPTNVKNMDQAFLGWFCWVDDEKQKIASMSDIIALGIEKIVLEAAWKDENWTNNY